MFAALNSFLTGALAKVTDVYWPFVSMLLHGDSAQQFNQDTSTNVFPITAVGAVQASTLTPFTGGPSSYGSGYFTGTASYLTVPDNAAFALGANDFTIECWIYPTTTGAIKYFAGQTDSGFGSPSFILYRDANQTIGATLYAPSGYITTSVLTCPGDAWSHVAFVRNGTTLRMYINGVQSGTNASISTLSVTDSTAVLGVGAGGGFVTSPFAGYISNFRLVNGTCLYPSGTTFTPPTVQLTAVTNTALLTLQTNVPQNNNQFFDTSTNNFTVTRNGNTTQGSFNPFVSTYPYSVATNGGSAYFDGTGDSLTVPDNAAFTLGTNDFTIECWINFSSLASQPIFTAQMNSAATVYSYYMVVLSTGQLNSVILDASTATTYTASSAASAILVNTWYHVAFVRNGNTNRQYINGVQAGTVSVTGITVRDSASLLGVGKAGEYAAGQLVTGYISNFRLVNGTCLYPSGTTFTPPTAPLTAVTNTALLLGMSNAAIFDNAILNNLETVASAQISTSVFKYGTGSMKFNGAGDALVTPNKPLFSFGTGDFTIEMWVYPNSFAGFNTLIDARSVGTASSYGLFTDSSTGKIYWYDASGVQLSSSGLTLNAWAHVAVSRTSGVLKLFIAGVQVYSAANTNAQNPTGNFVIGRNIESSPVYFNGYIDDLRVTKGIGRYTATFTPPTAAFPNSGGVQLVDYAVVAGGGGGGSDTGATGYGGGGGAGGYKTSSAMPLLIGTTYTITVGAGGAVATNGSTSTLAGSTTVSCTGGGAGGASKGPGGVPAGTNGSNGGSGGGGGNNNSSASSTTGGTGTSGQGFAGGLGSSNTGVGYGGGGGGAGGVGADGNVNYPGGAGVVYVGTGLGYSTGGDGRWTSTGASNTGNGGGAASAGAGAGGSGVVVFRTTAATAAATSTTGSPTITVSGGYRIYTFTASGTITF
jgi:hypothetical protein